MRRLAVAALIGLVLLAGAWQVRGAGAEEARRGDGLAGLHAQAEQAAAAPSYAEMQVMVCQDWRDAAPVRRRVIVSALRSVLGGEITGIGFSGRARVLADDHAVRLFDAHCGHDYARHFLLYKLYGQASGFAGVAS
ncbi:hypothetical protein [Nocardioides speluncae]|uniref:hypothetical protein n=1 Tax=Nocardioides speluncae TaxID=2670337 RepID=UPI000D6978A3|nr:hypothetical protein [Nocardioides speluncae]